MSECDVLDFKPVGSNDSGKRKHLSVYRYDVFCYIELTRISEDSYKSVLNNRKTCQGLNGLTIKEVHQIWVACFDFPDELMQYV